MTADAALRELTSATPPALIRLLTGAAVVERLPTEFPSAQERRVDALVRLDDGRILHLEWQARFDAAMPLRMLVYWTQIAQRHPGAEILQIVLQVGGGRMISDQLETQRLSFRYDVLDSRRIDPEPLLASPSVDDALLATVFGDAQGLAPRLRRILRRVAVLPERAQRDAMTRLLTLARARGAVALVMEEAQTMPLHIDPAHEDPYVLKLINLGRQEGINLGRQEGINLGRQEGINLGRQEGLNLGEARALQRVLERRFGPLPADVAQRLATAESETLDRWFDLAWTADNLTQVFDLPPLN